MSRSPNIQQEKAINATGGTCLSAGAGSGKTFVIVEKLLKIIESKKLDLFDFDENLMRSKVRKFLSTLVVMTFTKKAAGELKTRVVRRIESSEKNSEDLFLKIVKDEVGSIYIGTIHGFCFRLLRQGIFSGINPDIKITSEGSRRIQVVNAMKVFAEVHMAKYDESLQRLFYSSFQEISMGVYGIVSDPEQRMLWDERALGKSGSDSVNEDFWPSICEIENLNLIIKEFHEHLNYSSEESKSWYKAVESFNNLSFYSKDNLLDSTNALDVFFNTFKRIVKPKKIDNEELHLYIDQISSLRKIFKKYNEEINYYIKNREKHFSQYHEFFLDIYLYVSNFLTKSSEITFSDLEYLTLREIKLGKDNQEDSATDLRSFFSYFIVDEFQDTSNVQFQIIENLCQENFRNLFVVGDEKQAIYRFRGGEISLFSHVKTLMRNNLTLTNNYRSMPGVIEFNNHFSDKSFPLGPGFTGKDRYSVIPERQTIPDGKYEEDLANKNTFLIQESLDDGVKLTKQQIEKIEALMAKEHYKTIPKGEGVCFLYSKLTPVYYLIETLIQEQIPFQAQVKIPYKDNPLLAIIYSAIMGVLSKENNDEFSKFELSAWIIGNVIESIQGEASDNLYIKNCLRDLERDYIYYDLVTGLKKLLFKLGFNNPDSENNIKIISELIKQLGGNIEQVYNFLQEDQSSTYSFEYQYGSGEKPIKVMSVHASKGLEFDHVFILGAMTNGVTRPMDGLLGKKVGSFRWKVSFKDTKFQRSPEYIIEGHQDKFQDFSEQKRLIYVACTRAVKSLSLFRLKDSKGNDLSFGKNSWINSLKAIDDKYFNITKYNLDLDIEGLKKGFKIPFFQRDNFGISIWDNKNKNLLVSTEMSVSQLSDLAVCPRYFYLKHIVKFSEDETNQISEISKNLPPNLLLQYKNIYSEKKVTSDSLKSDSERGTFVHSMLEQWILSKGEKKTFFKKAEDELAFNFGRELLVPYINSDAHKLISEKDLKFDLFTQKISGKPDLVIFPTKSSSQTIEIWDFKTGEINSSNREKYFFQLNLYVQGISQLFPEYKEFCIKLICLDQENVESETFKIGEISTRVMSVLDRINEPQIKNTEYCNKCEMNKICLIGSKS